jgi:catechol 1,2-dioxygenase
MSKSPSPSRRQFIKNATVLTIGTVLVQGCGQDPAILPPDSSDPSAPTDPTNTGTTPDPSDPTTTTTPDPSETGEICETTSPDIEGPFYRDNPPHRAQLVTPEEPGRRLLIEGYVYASDCETPLSGAVVDIWHADDAGDYDNTSDAFRMRGQMTTNEDGYYAFTSIRPGRYLNGNTYRPEHIHYRVTYETGGSDTVSLITQLYFENDPFLETDPWAVPERTIALEDENTENFSGRFDVVLPVPVD